MKANAKRIFALLLCLVLCLGLIPVTMPTEADAAGGFVDFENATPEQIKAKISEIGQKINGRYWNAGCSDSDLKNALDRHDYIYGTTQGPCKNHGLDSSGNPINCTSNVFNSATGRQGWQCIGFGRYISYAVFGVRLGVKTWNRHSKADNNMNNITLEPGDVVEINKLEGFNFPHAFMVWYVEGENIYVANANNPGNCKITFGLYKNAKPYTVSQVINAAKNGTASIFKPNCNEKRIGSVTPTPIPTPTPPSFGAPSKTNGQNSSVNFGVKVQSTLSYSSSAKPSRWGVDIATSEALLKSSPTHVGLNSKYSSWLYDSISYKPGNSGETVSIDFSVEAANTSLLVAGTTYYYRFWTQYTANGDSSLKAYSAIKSFTTPGTAPQFTVTYNGNGGTPGKSSDKVNQGSSVTLPSATRTNSSAGNYTVTLNANGGSVSPGSLSAARTTSYSFKNWNTAQGGTGSAYNSGAGYKPSGNVTLYAQWNSSTNTAPVTLPTPARSGYSFKGWATSSTASSGTTGSYTPSGNVTLYATWQRTTYTITYNGNGGTPSRYSDTVTAGASVTFPTATRPGYCFLGWSPSAGEKAVYLGSSSGGSFTPSGDTTLYAVWQKDTPPRRPGDVNQDGVVDGKDVTRLCRYLAGFDVSISRQNADVNGDGQVDGKDVTRLRRYLAGFSIELL